jgi:hypothetical protein
MINVGYVRFLLTFLHQIISRPCKRFFKTLEVFDIILQAYLFDFILKILCSFEISRLEGNFEHLTYLKKKILLAVTNLCFEDLLPLVVFLV